jgi:hypothetical protein
MNLEADRYPARGRASARLLMTTRSAARLLAAVVLAALVGMGPASTARADDACELECAVAGGACSAAAGKAKGWVGVCGVLSCIAAEWWCTTSCDDAPWLMPPSGSSAPTPSYPPDGGAPSDAGGNGDASCVDDMSSADEQNRRDMEALHCSEGDEVWVDELKRCMAPS